ncbi:hypothetical protein LUZ63_000283 [Rhynchospora breviuscula]|uniref:Late embryogenesis abundant protein LEA-2 subgroup domain-containing protein n=1 Tax=Rhynchospora breviuscula TaxID=2022672 RepID=A0A9Q0CW19_9POAL|nr:hypothetical protein LUZ63_000283 [Rhynchospora breviuscula]
MDRNEENQDKKIFSSHAKCFCLLTILLLTIAILIVSAILVLKFVVRFRKPTFHLQSIQLDPNFRLDYTNSTMKTNHTCSVASLVFSTQNPNKFGIRYSSSLLRVLYQNKSVGMIEVPNFYQPPKAGNVTVFMHLLFKQLNISRAINEEMMAISGTRNDRFEIQINGAIKANTHVLNFPMPGIHVNLDCTISTNYSDIVASKGVHFVKKTKALSLSSFSHISQRCSMAMHINPKTVNSSALVTQQSCF